jgi:hypothetical protein
MNRAIGRRSLVAASSAGVLAALAGLAGLGGRGEVGRAWAGDDPLGAIRAARGRLRTLVARFRQERTMQLLATTVASEGEMTFAAPDRLRWELFAPDSIVYWIVASGLAYATPTSRGALPRDRAGAAGGLADDLPTVVGGDPARLRARYELGVRRLPGGRIELTATPRDPVAARRLRRCTIELGADLVSPARIGIEESATDRVEVRFSQVRVNGPVDLGKLVPPGW